MGITLPNPNNIQRQTPRSTAGTFLNAPPVDNSLGIAVSDIGNDAYKYAVQEKARMDQVAVDDAKNQYLTKVLDLENEYTQIRGKNAVDQDIVGDYTKKLKTISESIGSKLKDNTQKRLWAGYSDSDNIRFKAKVMEHKLAESDRYASETYQATNATRIQVAQSNWGDNKLVDQSASDIVNNIAKEKLRAGWDDTRTELEMMNALGPLWAGVTSGYINAKQYGVAKQLLEKHRDVIGINNYNNLQKAISSNETLDLSQQKADEIMLTVKGETEQLKAARKYTGQLRDDIITRVKVQQTEQRQAQNQEAQILKEQHDQEDQQIGDYFASKEYSKALNMVVNSKLLSGDEKRIWSDAIDTKSKNPNNQTAPLVYSDLLDQIDENPDKNAVKNQIIKNAGNLSDADYKGLLEKLRTKTNSLESKAETDGKNYIKSMIIPKRGSMSAYLSTPNEETDYYNAMQTFDTQIKKERESGTPPTPERINQLAQEISQKYSKSMQQRQEDYLKYMQEQYTKKPDEVPLANSMTDEQIKSLLKEKGFEYSDEAIKIFRKNNSIQ